MPANHVTHGMSKTRLYRIYKDMKNRCRGIKDHDRDNYFKRGITYCEQWEIFENFKDWALSNGYKDDLTLDRIDNDGNYEPSNCRWVTRKVQNNNTRANHFITFNGQKLTIAQWAEKLNINKDTLYSRLLQYKWSPERALKQPVRKVKRKICNM